MEKLPLTLCMEHGPGEGKSFPATHLQKVTIGRTRTNSYPIKDPTVSQKHAFIEWRVDHWDIVDIGSSNGTDVNGKVAVENQPMRLQNGDLIRFGESVRVRVQIEEEEDEEEEEVEVDEEEEVEEPGLTVEEWFEQERLRIVRTVQARADSTISEMKQNAEELKKRFREHAGIE